MSMEETEFTDLPREADSAENETQFLSATVKSVIFSNDLNGYAVLRVTDTDGQEQTVVGTFPFPWPGENIQATGQWTVHGEYGRQFAAVQVERSEPRDDRTVFSFLAAGTVKGIGPATAGQIVNRFKERALFVLEHDPKRLSEVPGISLKRAEQLSKEFRRQQGLRKLVLLLASCGVEPVYAVRLHRRFGEKALPMVQENPFLLTEEGIGAPFGEADRLAYELGIAARDPNRIRAGIRFVLEHNAQNGHCFIPYGKLYPAAAKQLEIEDSDVEAELVRMTEDRQLVRESVAGQDACYLPELYTAECETACRIAAMAAENGAAQQMPDLDRLMREFESEQGIRLAEQQKEILRYAARCRLTAVTGGPGTGKTTSLRAIVKLYGRMGLKTLLAAPTGRAAKRMSDLTGAEAMTVHRMLGAQFSEETGKTVFTKNSTDPLACGALIVDECSMVDIRLMYALLEALPETARLILVGDASQLPSVGPGDVFSAILRSEAVPSVRLTEIFRQQDGSPIVRNAHLINRGEYPDLSENTGDFFRLKRMQAATAAETAVELCSTRLPQKLNILPDEIQVLSPTRRGACGTVELNRMLQAALNPQTPGKKERALHGVIFREGDRLIQTRNNYDILWMRADGSDGTGIYNGDIGILRKLDPEEGSLTVEFDGRFARYDAEMADDLEHAWALTVHKAQGCEYRAVVMVLSDASRRLLTRRVLYTGVTRARELLILVGDDHTVFQMIDNVAPTLRYNALRVRIRALRGL